MAAFPSLSLDTFDAALASALQHEQVRQEQHIELIASENYASPRVMQVQGSVLTNKYAEGYPSKRYYGGCEFVDQAEQLAIERAQQLFGAAYANVQPHSGAQANAAVLLALMQPGETLLGMSLAEGGHLTHGTRVNYSGKFYQAVQYGVDKNGLLDYQQVADLAQQHRPKVIIAGFSAYSRRVDWQIFRDIADSIDAYLMVDMAHVAGLIAAGLYPSPIPYADVVTSTTHKTLRGPRGGLIVARDNPELTKKLQSAVFPGLQGGPLMHVIAAKAVAFLEALQPEFKVYQQQVLNNAHALAHALQAQGFPIISGGTDNHLLLMDVSSQQLTGKTAEAMLQVANITTNKNTIPHDTQSPFVTSGLRLGTPATTTRGFKEPEMQLIANWIGALLIKQISADEIKGQVLDLCAKFLVYASD